MIDVAVARKLVKHGDESSLGREEAKVGGEAENGDCDLRERVLEQG